MSSKCRLQTNANHIDRSPKTQSKAWVEDLGTKHPQLVAMRDILKKPENLVNIYMQVAKVAAAVAQAEAEAKAEAEAEVDGCSIEDPDGDGDYED